AMTLQLEHFFAGVGMRGGEIKRDAVVYRRAARIEESRPDGTARRGRFAEDCQRERHQTSARHSHHTYARASGSGGYCRNRVIQLGHGLALQETVLETRLVSGRIAGAQGL